MQKRETTAVKIEFIAELEGTITHLGNIIKHTHPQQSNIFYCERCGSLVARVMVQNTGRNRPRVLARGNLCGDCGGDSTILFSSYWGYILQEVNMLPDKFIAYECQCLMESIGRPEYRHDLPQYGKELTP